MVDVKVTGMQDILKKLKTLPERVQKNVLTGGIRAGAAAIAKEAKAKVPKSSGELKKSIGVVKRKSRDKTIVSFTVAPRLKKDHGFLAHFHEFGTSTMAATPFMRPAYESRGAEAIDVTKQYMTKRIDKEVAKL